MYIAGREILHICNVADRIMSELLEYNFSRFFHHFLTAFQEKYCQIINVLCNVYGV